MTASHLPEQPLVRDPRFATTLAHGLDILRAFRVAEPALSNREFVDRTGLSKATVSRLTSTLSELGFLNYDGAIRKYRLGSAVLSVGYPLLSRMQIRQVARPLMKTLADHARGSVSLGMRDRTQMIYIETVRGHDAIAFRPDIGASLPMLRTAMGRAWLAGAPTAQRDAVLEQVRAAYPEQWATYGAGVRRNLREFAQRGYCTALGDWQRDVNAVAVPVSRSVDGVSLVFNCGVPTLFASRQVLEDDLGPRLIALVREAEAALGRS